MRKSSFETEKPSSEPGGCRGLSKLLQKTWKKFLTKADEFDKINELLIERTAKRFERTSKNKLKKFLTNVDEYDNLNKLFQTATTKNLDN